MVIAGSHGGEVKIEGVSNPEDVSKYAAWDYLLFDFVNDTNKAIFLRNTVRLSILSI